MDIKILENKKALGAAAAKESAGKINAAIAGKGSANIILPAGSSQYETLKHLLQEKVDWTRVVVFHLDEYLDIPETHKASFRKYLKERFIDIVGDLKEVYLIRAYENGEEEAVRMSGIIKQYPIDLALVGIGENGHLAFNDPPADFKSEDPYLVVELDEVCRRQQVSEGWFDFLEDVPRKAISMSIGQILKSASIICSVPERRKAEAVKNCLTGEVDRNYPSSVLQTHNNCTVYLDKDSSVLLSGDRIV